MSENELEYKPEATVVYQKYENAYTPPVNAVMDARTVTYNATQVGNLRNAINRFNDNLNAGRDKLVELVNNEELDSDTACEIANAFNVELMAEDTITFNVAVTVTVQRPICEELADRHDFDVDITFLGEGDAEADWKIQDFYIN